MGSLDVYKGSATLGELELYLTRDANNVAGYWFIWEGASGADTFSVSVNEMDVAFIHNDPGDASSAVPAKVLLDDLPAVGTYTQGQSVYVKRGTGANQKIWEYTILGAGAARKWVKTAGDRVLLGTYNYDSSDQIWRDTGFTLPSWTTNMQAIIRDTGTTYSLFFTYAIWNALSGVANQSDGSLGGIRTGIPFGSTSNGFFAIGKLTSGNVVFATGYDVGADTDAQPLEIWAI